MGVRELTPSQHEFFETCRRGDVDKVKGYIANKKGKKPRSPLNFLRPATPSAGWLAAFKDPSSLYTPLHYAALHGHHSVCKVLVESDRLLPSARDKRGCVPLHLAAWNGHFETVKLLAESDPDSVDAVNNAQESSLHLAAQHGHDKLVRVLLEHHADPRLRNARFETPLDVAARTGHAVVCKILIGFCPELALQSAVDCSSTAENGRVRAQVVYPLHAAARHSHIQCLQMLRLGGFDIDFVTDEGSALHVAAMFGQVDAVKYLTEEGINPHMRDSKGRTALEVLREQEQHRTSDLTYIIQSREGWSECRKIIDDYLQRLDSDHFNSSSDSGIERRDSEKSAADDDVIGDIWRPLPYNSNVNSPRKPPDEAEPCQPSGACHITVDQFAPSTATGAYDNAVRTSEETREGSLDDSSIATVCSQPQGAPIHRTWNSRMYDIERGIARFPITSPMNKSRHQKSKRTSDTLPLSLSGARTGGLQQPRGSILPSDPQNCFYRAPPPVFDVWHQKFVQSDGITHTYNPAFPYDNVPKNMLTYDNAPQPGRSTWDHDCSHSTGRATAPTMAAIARRPDGSHTLPTSRPRIRPVLANTFAATSESPFEEQTQEMRINDSSFAALRGREDSIGLGHSPLLNSRDPSIGFACSTLGRSASPDTLSAATPTGRAPLAMPEELTGSTSTSILSSSVSPERDLSRMVSSNCSAATSSTPLADEERLAANDRSSTEFSLSTLTVNYSDGPPSPDSSRSRIFNTLISNSELSDKLTSKQFPLSPSATECSSGTMASSCSLPMVSQISTTPPSDSSFYKLYHQNSLETSPSACVKIRPEWEPSSARPLETGSSKGSENQSINELDEWKKIDDILSSFGGAVCRESVFAANYEPQVAVFLRDRRSQALTLQLSSPSIGGTRLSANSSASNSSYKFEPDSATMSQWLVTSVGIPNPKAKEIGRILTRAGFDRTTQLDGCLTAREMTALGIEKHVQQQILNYLATTVKCVRPNAGSFNYVSDWLCSLELTDYLGNFVTAGLKSMLIVRTTDLTRDHLEKMGITLPGHIARILHSLMEAKIEEACHRTERLREMRQAVTSTTTSNASNILKPEPSEESPSAFEEAAVDGGETMKRNLLHGHASFSAHYLGSMEISNIDSTEESRRAMAKLKKAIREIAKVPQVFLEISIHGVRILDGKNGQLAVEHEISHIQIVCQDERDLNCFTYISQDAEKNLCHVFCVLTADVATEIIVTLGQAFELAYKLQSGVPLEEITNV